MLEVVAQPQSKVSNADHRIEAAICESNDTLGFGSSEMQHYVDSQCSNAVECDMTGNPV